MGNGQARMNVSEQISQLPSLQLWNEYVLTANMARLNASSADEIHVRYVIIVTYYKTLERMVYNPR